jgi:hypothetical protein
VLRSATEAGEPDRGTPCREGSTGNTGQFERNMAETSSSTTVSTKLGQIAKLARELPQAALTTLAQHIDIDWLREAYRRTRITPALSHLPMSRSNTASRTRKTGGLSTRKPAARRAEIFRPFFLISTCTKCWTGCSPDRWCHGSSAARSF